MNVAFRVDATQRVGSGHFMRCLALADELQRRGARLRFVCRDLPEHLQRELSQRGIERATLASSSDDSADRERPHAAWLGTSQAADAEQTCHAIRDLSCDWVIVDHYAIDSLWEADIRSVTRRVMAIDDLTNREHVTDVLLDQNLRNDAEAAYCGKVPDTCRLLLGPTYALVRDEFRELRPRVRSRMGSLDRVLISFGGVDTANQTSRAIAAAHESGIEFVRVDVVVGAEHPKRLEIVETCDTIGFTSHIQTDRMAALMASADLAIGAAGSTSWERCCLGLPAICVAVAANQQPNAEGLHARGAGLMVPFVESTSGIADALLSLRKEPALLARMSSVARELVDGRGAQRVSDVLLSCR